MYTNFENNSLTFPVKLKKIVDATETDHLIYWDEDGTSFHIADENQFAREVIPNYFKHSNISSFIRQLNMYGFHKINRVEGGLNVSGQEDSQWKHPSFIRDRSDLLANINRKVTIPTTNVSPSNDNSLIQWPYSKHNIPNNARNDVIRLVKAVQYLKKQGEETGAKLKAIEEENSRLYNEMMFLRQEHSKQSKLIDLLVNFFSACTTNGGIGQRLKPKRNLLALDMPKYNNDEPPSKYFVTSPTNSNDPNTTNLLSPPPYKLVNNHSNIGNSSNPNRKVIRITNFNDSANSNTTITAKASPSTSSSLVQTSSNPDINHKRVYTVSLSKQPSNTNNNMRFVKLQPIKAIQAPPIEFSSSKQPISDACKDTAFIEQQSISSPDLQDLNLDDLLDDEDNSNTNDVNLNNLQVALPDSSNNPTNLLSQITSNVNNVSVGLNNIKRMLTMDNSSPSQQNIFLDSSPTAFNSSISSHSQLHNEEAQPSMFTGVNIGDDDGEEAYPLKNLWESIHNENLGEDFLQESHDILAGPYPQHTNAPAQSYTNVPSNGDDLDQCNALFQLTPKYPETQVDCEVDLDELLQTPDITSREPPDLLANHK